MVRHPFVMSYEKHCCSTYCIADSSAPCPTVGCRGIDDGQGWRTPQPAGVCDMCTEEKNALAGEHTVQVVNPLVPPPPNIRV